jgi:hypothetical protein
MESSVTYLKAALLARLKADATLVATEAGIFRGNPHPTKWPAKAVIIGKVSGWQLTFVCGMSQANEEYDLEIIANYAGSAQNSNTTYEDGAYGLMVAVLASLVTWHTGDNLVTGTWGQVNAIIPSAAGDAEGLDEGGRDSTVTMTVHVTARLV